jgi:hypothetical protein
MEVKRRRKLELKERKNYLPTVLITVGLWLSVIAFIFFADPQAMWSIPIFLLLVFSSITFTFSVVLGNTRRGILIAMAITIILGLRIVNMATAINVVLLLGALAAFEFYYSRM